MKLHYSLTTLVCIFTFLTSTLVNGQVGINTTTPDTNSILDVVSTTKGILIPRLDQTETNTLANIIPADGIIIYNSTAQCIQIYKRSSPTTGAFDCLVVEGIVDNTNDAWVNDSSSGNKMVKLGTQSDTTPGRDPGTEVVIKDTGKMGIGTTDPSGKLDVSTNDISGYVNVANFHAPSNITAGNASAINLGTTTSSKNEAQLRYIHTASGSDFNRLDIGFNGVSLPTTSILASGNVGIKNITPTATLDVNGTVEIVNVNNVPIDTTYKTLVWNPTTFRVETTSDNSNIKRNNNPVASGAETNIGTPLTMGSSLASVGYEIKILTANGCGVSTYNTFIATGSNSGFWRISHIGGISQNGSATSTSSDQGATVTVVNPLSGGCGDGGTASALNFTLKISSAGQLSITNNGNIARSYKTLISRVID